MASHRQRLGGRDLVDDLRVKEGGGGREEGEGFVRERERGGESGQEGGLHPQRAAVHPSILPLVPLSLSLPPPSQNTQRTLFKMGRSSTGPSPGARLKKPSTVGKKPANRSQKP